MPQFFSTTCLGRRSGFLCFFGGQARPKSILPAAADGSNAETAKELDEEKHMEEPKVDKSQPSQPSFAKLVQRFQTALKMVMLGALFLSMLCVLGAVISNVQASLVKAGMACYLLFIPPDVKVAIISGLNRLVRAIIGRESGAEEVKPETLPFYNDLKASRTDAIIKVAVVILSIFPISLIFFNGEFLYTKGRFMKVAEYTWSRWSGDVKSAIEALVLFIAFSPGETFKATKEKYETGKRLKDL